MFHKLGKDPTPTELHEKTEGVNLFWIYRFENTMFMTAISCINNFYFSFMYFLVYIFRQEQVTFNDMITMSALYQTNTFKLNLYSTSSLKQQYLQYPGNPSTQGVVIWHPCFYMRLYFNKWQSMVEYIVVCPLKGGCATKFPGFVSMVTASDVDSSLSAIPEINCLGHILAIFKTNF
jgi:hypothetical protein